MASDPTKSLISADRALTSHFVGRKREIEEMRGSLDAAISGRGQIVLIAGDAGIGKTRLAEELARIAQPRGSTVVWGRCWEGSGAPAFWPWIQVLRDLLGNADEAMLKTRLGDAAALLIGIPNRGAPVPGGESDDRGAFSSPLTAGEEPFRFRLFDSVSTFLKQSAQMAPLMIVLDDLHAADIDSLILLRFVARDLRGTRTLFVGTYREIEARISSQHSDLLNQVGREGAVMHLRGLTKPDIAEFIESHGGFAPEPGLVSTLDRATQGNPFFLDEVVRSIGTEARYEPHRIRLPVLISEGIRAAIRHKVAPLNKSTRALIGLCAVLGGDLEFPVLLRTSDLPFDELVNALGEAAAYGLITKHPSVPDRYAFSHPMIPETIRDELPKIQRLQLHIRIGEALEELHGSAAGPHLSEIVHHYLQALPLGGLERAYAYTIRAAGYAMKQLAYEEATRLYQAALEHLDVGSKSSGLKQCELLLALGEAHGKSGHAQEAQQSLFNAFELARGIRRPDLMGLAALGAALQGRVPGVFDTTTVRLLEEALGSMERTDSSLRSLVLAALASNLHWSDRFQEAKSLSERAEEMARRLNDTAALASALWTRHALLWSPDNVSDRLAAANEIIRLAQISESIDWILRGHDLRVVALLECGNIRDADLALAGYQGLAEHARLSLARPKTLQATRAMMNGDYDEAERLAREALDVALRRQEPGAQMSYEAQVCLLRTEQSRLEEVESVLKRRVSEYPALVIFRCGLAACYSNLGKKELARAEFECIAADNFALIPRDWNWLAAIAMSSHVCAFLGDVARAEILYGFLKSYADRNIIVGWGEACYGSASKYLGILASKMSRLDEAELHFETALDFDRRMGAVALVAHTECDYAEMLISRRRPGDLERAFALATSARASATSLGMVGLEKQTDAVLAACSEDESKRLASTVAPGAENVFQREGEYWTITFDGQTFRLKHAKGLDYLAYLMMHAGREVFSPELVASVAEGAEEAHFEKKFEFERMSVQQLADKRMRIGPLTDAGEMLDARAREAYRRRLLELREEIQSAKALGDIERAVKAEEEWEDLTRELKRAVGLGGRHRKAASTSERARLNVTRAIKVAIERIAEAHPGLGAHMSRSVRTGIFCCYRPDGVASIQWRF